jgi:hypothetical protein
MATNLGGKKMHTHQHDEIKYVFTPIEHNHNSNIYIYWINSREEERAWANKAR